MPSPLSRTSRYRSPLNRRQHLHLHLLLQRPRHRHHSLKRLPRQRQSQLPSNSKQPSQSRHPQPHPLHLQHHRRGPFRWRVYILLDILESLRLQVRSPTNLLLIERNTLKNMAAVGTCLASKSLRYIRFLWVIIISPSAKSCQYSRLMSLAHGHQQLAPVRTSRKLQS
jgi:hypothetical protein